MQVTTFYSVLLTNVAHLSSTCDTHTHTHTQRLDREHIVSPEQEGGGGEKQGVSVAKETDKSSESDWGLTGLQCFIILISV